MRTVSKPSGGFPQALPGHVAQGGSPARPISPKAAGGAAALAAQRGDDGEQHGWVGRRFR